MSYNVTAQNNVTNMIEAHVNAEAANASVIGNTISALLNRLTPDTVYEFKVTLSARDDTGTVQTVTGSLFETTLCK